MTAEQNARWRHTLILVLVFNAVSLLGTAATYGRTWTDVAGERTIDARFITFQFDKVWLLRRGGQTFGIAITDLCAEDQEYVREELRTRRSKPVARTVNPPGRVPYGTPRELGRLANGEIGESSGLATSVRNPGCFWTHNDSGSESRAYLFDATGRDVGSLCLEGIVAFDWEDMVSFRLDGKCYLAFCDVGNNGRAAGVQMLHIVEEPAFDIQQGNATKFLPVSRTIHFAYEDDRRDCEAVGFDAVSKKFLFVTKESGRQCQVYQLPWPAEDVTGTVVAQRIASLLIDAATAMDISPDGRRAVVLTYGNAFEYHRQRDQDWTQAFADAPREIVAPERIQGESVCFGPDGQTIYLTSERVPTPLWSIPLVGWSAGDSLVIDCDFPGGNIVVERVQGDDVYVHQDLRDTSTWWFYWCFRVRGAEARRLTFHFTNKNVFGARGPAASTDGGATWAWLGAQATQGSSFSYQFSADEPEVRFCFAMPYQESHLQRFLQLHAENPNMSVGELCRTPKGRVVRRLDVGKLDGEPAHRILLTARHHACESMASYVLEGFLQSVLSDTDDGRWYRENVRALVVPIVDKDGVQDGDQGKNRRPHDHNRDYQGASIYPSVAAIKALVPTWAEGRLEAAIDLHCPWIRGQYNEVIYMVGRPEASLWRQQTVFGEILEQVQQGSLVYRASDNLPYGQAWNTDGNYGGKMSFGMWAAQLPDIRLASTIEVPYANAGGRTVDAASARAFGGDLARAMRRYLTDRRD